MTDRQIRDRIVGALSVSMMPMELEAECVAFLDRCIAMNMNGWIPAAERLPEPFQRVIVYRNDGIVEQGYKDVRDWWKVFGTRTKQVTHWMPFPDPPEGERHA